MMDRDKDGFFFFNFYFILVGLVFDFEAMELGCLLFVCGSRYTGENKVQLK